MDINRLFSDKNFLENEIRTINEHLKNIFNSNELIKSSTIRNFRIAQIEGFRKVERIKPKI